MLTSHSGSRLVSSVHASIATACGALVVSTCRDVMTDR